MARIVASLLVLGFVAIAAPRAAAYCDSSDEAYQGPGSSEPRQGEPREGERRQGERRIKWWLDEKSRLELGITNQQSADIEQIFQGTLPTLRQVRKELDELESKLSQMIKEGTAPVPTITEQVERVENARAEMNKLRTVMLYRIDRVLSADQRARLKAWHERQGNQRPGGSGRH